MFIGYIGTDSIGSLIKRAAKKAGVEDGRNQPINVKRSSITGIVPEELITDVRKPRHEIYDVIVGGELFTDYSDHPRRAVTLSKTQINRRRTLPASFPLALRDAYRKQQPERLPRKVRTLWHYGN